MDIHVNGTRLWVETAGTGEAMVLVHGFGLDRRLWDGQFDDWARRRQVVRYDLRGFGRSAVPDGPYRHADDLNAVLDHLALNRVILVGLSLGGWVALNATLDRPARVRALVLADAILDKQPMSAAWEAEVKPIWREAKTAGAAVTKARWLNTRLFAAARESPVARLRLAQMSSDWSGWQFLNRDPEATGGEAVARLGDVRAPTLVLVGERESPDFQGFAETLLAIPGSRQVVLPGVGHLTPLEAPEAFNAAVEEFLSGLPA